MTLSQNYRLFQTAKVNRGVADDAVVPVLNFKFDADRVPKRTLVAGAGLSVGACITDSTALLSQIK